ncbi:hypothetical protein ACQ4PT_015586 [Festuca glaucescens]
MGFGFDAAVRTTQRWLQQVFPPADSGPATSWADSNATTCQQGDISQAAENMRQEPMFEKLPEDIRYHIHSLLPVQDAGRAACVSHGFLRSWRCYPNLALNERTLGLAGKKIKGSEINLICIVDPILKNHSGLKTLKLDLLPYNNISASYLDRWLHPAVHSGVKELSLELSSHREERLPSIARNVKSLTLASCGENVNTLMLLSKLPRLKKLDIRLLGLEPAFSPHYDALSLVSFLQASPALYSFILRINQDVMCHDSVVGDDYVYLRKKPEFR